MSHYHVAPDGKTFARRWDYLNYMRKLYTTEKPTGEAAKRRLRQEERKRA